MYICKKIEQKLITNLSKEGFEQTQTLWKYVFYDNKDNPLVITSKESQLFSVSDEIEVNQISKQNKL